MKAKQFFLGFGSGLIVSALAWYYSKSTSSEEGALNLLDRLAEVEAQNKRLRGEVAHLALSLSPQEPDDLTAVNGIGPVFAAKLQGAGIHTVAELADLPALRLATILDVGPNRAEAIRVEARSLI